MKKYDIALMNFSELENKVKVPTFQRGIKWGTEKRNSFLENIKKGYPFGSILVKRNIQKGEFLLLDGLQRYSTLREAKKNREMLLGKDEYVSLAESAYDFLNVGNLSESKKSEVIEKLIDLLKQSKNAVEFSENVDREFTIKEDKKFYIYINEVYHEKEKMMNNLIDFDNLKIPTIIFEGEGNELVEIFQSLNEGGIVLSKYDVFAASWSSEKSYKIDESDIIETIIKRYENMYDDSGIEIEGFVSEEFRENKTINLFEYCFALGKKLSETYTIVSGKKKVDDVESIGFSILAVCMKISLKHVGRIGEKSSKIDSDFLMKIYNSSLLIFKDMEKAITKYTSVISKNIFLYKEMQIVSMFAELFHTKYEIDEKDGEIKLIDRPRSKDYYKNILENIGMYYLYDNLDGTWTSNGDVKVDDIVIHNNFRYNKKIVWSQFDSRLQSYLYDERNKDKVNVKKETKLILSYLLRDDITYLGDKLDFEHIIPVNKCTKLDKFCGSALGNICVLSNYSNRKKKDLTIYELVVGNELKIDHNILEKSLYPPETQIDFIHGIISDENKDRLKSEAINFVEEREKSLNNIFYNKYKEMFKEI